MALELSVQPSTIGQRLPHDPQLFMSVIRLTHVLLQQAWPVGQQWPLQHACPGMQQSLGPQANWPRGHWQVPCWHLLGRLHTLPQLPQLLLSVLRSTQLLPQQCSPGGQQWPLQHACVSGQQGFLQGGLRQQSRVPAGHWQVPPMPPVAPVHVRPPTHLSLQSAQSESVPSLVGVHWGRQHFSPGWMARPQLPQLASEQVFVHLPSQHSSLNASHGSASQEPQNNGSLCRLAQ